MIPRVESVVVWSSMSRVTVVPASWAVAERPGVVGASFFPSPPSD